MNELSPIEVAESVLMALRPVGADYLGVEPYERGWSARVMEMDGTLREGIGPEPLYAIRAVIAYYRRRPPEDPIVYTGPDGDYSEGES